MTELFCDKDVFVSYGALEVANLLHATNAICAYY